MHSYSLTTALVLSVLVANTVAAPHPWTKPQAGSAYTGNGGSADGGAVNDLATTDASDGGLLGGNLLSVLSDNAGSGGKANSGDAFGGLIASSPGSGTKIDGTGGSAYTGVGGSANGGEVTDNSTPAVKIASDNGGSGGDASSGDSYGGDILQGVEPTDSGDIIGGDLLSGSLLSGISLT